MAIDSEPACLCVNLIHPFIFESAVLFAANSSMKGLSILDCDLLETVTDFLPDHSGLKSYVKVLFLQVNKFIQKLLFMICKTRLDY